MLEKRLRGEERKFFNRSRVRAYKKTIRKIHREELQYRAEKRKIQRKIRTIEAREDAQVANLASIPGDIHIKVSRYSQTMRVYKGKKLIYTWLVSTGKKGYTTPMGNYKPYYTVKMHYSRKWNMSPMPYSVFYYKGYAIHGTNYASRLGSRASHGCIRLSTRNARKVYNLAKRFGYRRMHIQVT
ncbi:MAG: L,D-transpeptidase family protein [Sulfurovum sp.]|nr:L,D-transpeptidase family protein [Sulfurovum sp.]